jgi:predicted MFS family arabinose efflux permease
VSLVFGVIEGPERGWISAVTMGAFVAAAVFLVAFIRWELRRQNPMLDPRLFRLPGFGAGSAAVTLAFFSLFGMFFLLTQYLQFVKGYTPLGAGLRVLPNAAALMITSPQAPKLVARFGVKRVLRTGFLVTAVGFVLLASATVSTPDAVVWVALLCTGSGMAMVMPGASQHIVGSLPLAKAGVGSAVNDVTREVGGALGIAVAGSIVATVYRAADVAGASIGEAFALVRSGQVPAGEAGQVLAAAGDAFTDGTRVAFAVMATVAVLAGAFVARVIPDQLPSRQPSAS